jgi:hypothetical protein
MSLLINNNIIEDSLLNWAVMGLQASLGKNEPCFHQHCSRPGQELRHPGCRHQTSDNNSQSWAQITATKEIERAREKRVILA